MTLTIPGGGDPDMVLDFNRHAPAPVITPAIAYETLLDTFPDEPKTVTYVWYDYWTTERWISSQTTYEADGTFTRLGPDDNGDPTVSDSTTYRYQIINGILHGSRIKWYIAALSYDATLSAHLECYRPNYQDLNDCGVGDSGWVFDDATDASNFRNNENAAQTPDAVDASAVFGDGSIHWVGLENYEVSPGTWVDTPSYGTIDGNTVSGTVNDTEFQLTGGVWTEQPERFKITLTAAGWVLADESFDTLVIPVGATATLRAMEGQDIVSDFDISFSEIDISGQSLLTHVDPELFPFMEYGSFSDGARLYETTITYNLDDFTIEQWDGCNGAFNGNCNTVWLQDLDRINGTVGAVTATEAVDLAFVNDSNSAIRVGNGHGGSLLAVFATGGVLELWEVDWTSGNTAVYSGNDNDGSWSERTLNDETLTLVDFTIPELFSQSNGGDYDIRDSDNSARFFSVHNGYLRHGEVDGTDGDTNVFPMFNQTALQNIRDSITSTTPP
jgi:hypothetical protein